MRQKRILIDMDEVMADVIPKFTKIYEREMGKPLKKEDYWGKKIYDIEGAKALRGFLHEKGFFADLPVMPDSKAVIQELMGQYEVFIVTAAMEFKNSFVDKYEWLERHFPFIHYKNIVFCGQKGMLEADYMIDDHVRNIEAFKGYGLLYTACHNIHEAKYTRVNNWKEIREFFKIEDSL